MSKKTIGICAPSTAILPEHAEQLTAFAAAHFPQVELQISDQCFAEGGHFAGDDARRTATFVAMANDPALDAIWFARGGYGAARIASDVVGQLNDHARRKCYMGYSDGGNMLAALYRAGIGRPVHGPMAIDITRDGGEDAAARALGWFAGDDPAALEPTLEKGRKYAAFNLMTLSMMVGMPHLPDLSGHIVLIEEIAEYHYAFDRAMVHVTSALSASSSVPGGSPNAGLAGIALGRVSQIPENDRPFGENGEEIVRRCCARANIPYHGRVDIGHDAQNKLVPFGVF